MIAKIIGPPLFGRLWCRSACWIVMVLDQLPFKQLYGRLPEPLGTLFAARLGQGSYEVSLLVRLQCPADLRKHGLVLEDALTPLPIVERLDPDDACNLIAIIMR